MYRSSYRNRYRAGRTDAIPTAPVGSPGRSTSWSPGCGGGGRILSEDEDEALELGVRADVQARVLDAAIGGDVEIVAC